MTDKTYVGAGIPERRPHRADAAPQLLGLYDDDDEEAVVVDVGDLGEVCPVVLAEPVVTFIPPSERVEAKWEHISFFVEPIPDALTFFAEPYTPSAEMRDETAAVMLAVVEKTHPGRTWDEMRAEAYRLADEHLMRKLG